jgi:putative selenium metabolism hydrolase
MIRAESAPGDEGRMAALVENQMNELGFDRIEVDGFGNVVGLFEHGDGPTVVFDAHMDTVSAGPEEDWQYGPYEGSLKDGRIYGRGAMDMKGPAAAMLCALSEVGRGRRFQGKLVASLSVMEEVIEAAALKHVLQHHPADAVVICEASGCNLMRGQRGRAEIVLTAHGRSSHSSHPQYGVDAVEVMMPALESIGAMELPQHEFMGRGIHALTGIVSLPHPPMSSVPHTCIANFDRRLLVNEGREKVLQEYRELIAGLSLPEGAALEVDIDKETLETYTGRHFEVEHYFPAWLLPEDHPVALAGLQALRGNGLEKAVFGSYGYCTNGSLGKEFSELPRLGFGPGNELLAHRSDEYIEIEDLEGGYLGYKALATGLGRALS